MNYGNILYADIANGPGCRTSLFVSGCTHHCEGCFNAMTWDFSYGSPFTAEVEEKIMKSLEPDYIAGLTLLGGEPMEVVNQRALYPFLKRMKERMPNKTLWIYSGYLFEELLDENNKRCHCPETDGILKLTDVLVDGEFVQGLKDITLKFRGSSNQRIIDVPHSLESGGVVFSPYMR